LYRIQTTHSNHELETQPDNTSFASYLARYPNKGSLTYPNAVYNKLNESYPKGIAPLDIGTSGQETPLYYSTDAGLVHWVHITSYTDFWPGSNQYQWLVNDLQSVDRNVTPWCGCMPHLSPTSNHHSTQGHCHHACTLVLFL